MRNVYLRIFCSFLILIVIAAAAEAKSPPSADKVFQLSTAKGAEGALVLSWLIAPGNYLYRDKITVTNRQGTPAAVITPPGETKDDPSFGETEIYHGQLQVIVPAKSFAGRSDVVVSFQGCAEQGICYPPVTKLVDVKTLLIAKPAARAELTTSADGSWVSNPVLGRSVLSSGETAIPQQAFGLQGNFVSMLTAFVGFGLLLAFTPCVFPMVPILSGILAQSGERLTARRGFTLSGIYVVAMALAYASLGAVVAWSGQNLQAELQTPVALSLMSAIFVALALSMFGLYDLQLPQSWTARLVGTGIRSSGSIGGAAILGFGSALIVGPCVTPPLAAALVFVAQTGNIWRGASALFALGIGMGLPLLAFGTFGAAALPKSGPWLAHVKRVFGFVFLGLAIWVISRVLSIWIVVMLWGVSFVGTGIYLAAPKIFGRKRGQSRRAWAAVTGIVSIGFGAFLTITSVFGSLGMVGQFAGIGANAAEFETVTTPQALNDSIARATQRGKPVMLEFSAEWCVECTVMDRTVFSEKAVMLGLRDFALIRADATKYNEDARSLMKRFGVVGPPTIVFLGAQDGKEMPDARIIGPVNLATFLERLNQLRPL